VWGATAAPSKPAQELVNLVVGERHAIRLNPIHYGGHQLICRFDDEFLRKDHTSDDYRRFGAEPRERGIQERNPLVQPMEACIGTGFRFCLLDRPLSELYDHACH